MIEDLIAELMRKVPELDGCVFPVAVPADHRAFPLCVLRHAGGIEHSTSFSGGALVPQIQISVFAAEYSQVTELMRKVEEVAEGLSYGLVNPPDDSFHQDLGDIYEQSIGVSLQP